MRFELRQRTTVLSSELHSMCLKAWHCIYIIGLGVYSVHILIRPTVSSITIYLTQYDRKLEATMLS
jgi:hypothetical protein